MVSSQPKNGAVEFSAKVHFLALLAMIVCACAVNSARAQQAQTNGANESSAATTQISTDNTNPTRTTESHSKSGNTSVDHLTLEQLGPEGKYLPEFETEKETVQVDPSTTTTVDRTYQWDANGQKTLVQVKEETRKSANGESHVVRTTSNSDSEGKLQVIQRENADTKETGPDARETKTTSYVLDSNGALTPSLQTQEMQKQGADKSVGSKTTTLVPDSSGAWKVGEVRESSVKVDGKNQTSEERVSSADLEGHLSEVSRSVSQVTEIAPGEEKKTVDTYSPDLPGVSPDGSLHLNRRVTTVQKKDSAGVTTEQQVEQPKLDEPRSGLQVSEKSKNVVQYSISGMEQSKTTEVRDINGTLDLAAVEKEKSDQVPAGDVQAAPASKPQ